MIHMMEDDAQYCSSFSPSFRGLRHISMNTGKRARSPEDYESSGTRPLKRPSLAIGEFNRRHPSYSSANSSRQGSEDWVHAAGGLTIESPVYTTAEHKNPFVTHGAISDRGSSQAEEDVDMAMDSEQSGELGTRPHLEPLHTSFNLQQQQQSRMIQSSNDLSQQHTPHRHPYGTRYSEKVHGTAMPQINVLPATPVTTLQSSQQQQYCSAGNIERLNYNPIQQMPPASSPSSYSPMPMAVSPQNSYAQFASPTKRRVAFGPRANCEKCRLGVAGHFIHYEA